MAEQAQKPKPEEPPAPRPAEEKKAPEPKGGLFKSTPIALGAVMVVEAVVLFAGFKFLGGGGAQKSHGADIVSGEAQATAGPTTKSETRKMVEVPIAHMKAPNGQTGRTVLFDVQIVATVRAEHAERVKQSLDDRKALIQHSVRTIVAQSDPQKLGGGAEPGLETLRRQVKYQLDEIIGEGMIEEVLVPICTPFRADF